MLKSSRLAIVLTALLLVSAAPALASGHGQSVRIHGAVLTEGPPPDEAAPGCASGAIWRFSRAGTGPVTRLGRAEAALSHCTSLVPDESGAFHAIMLDGTIDLTAANGDTLKLAYEGVTDAIMDGADYLGYTAQATWTVTGATGRFTHATGSGWLDVVGDVPGGDALFGLPDGFDRWELGGTIAYDASDRSK